jgi:hypothetical protein
MKIGAVRIGASRNRSRTSRPPKCWILRGCASSRSITPAFSLISAYSGESEPGFEIDFLGIKTRSEFLAGEAFGECCPASSQGRTTLNGLICWSPSWLPRINTLWWSSAQAMDDGPCRPPRHCANCVQYRFTLSPSKASRGTIAGCGSICRITASPPMPAL